jgi:hypothetical protein
MPCWLEQPSHSTPLKCGEGGEAAAILSPRAALPVSAFLSRMHRRIDTTFRACPFKTLPEGSTSFPLINFCVRTILVFNMTLPFSALSLPDSMHECQATKLCKAQCLEGITSRNDAGVASVLLSST